MKKFDFTLTIPFEKAEREDGWYITALASGPEIDSRRERIHPQALEGFVNQIEKGPLPFLNWHNRTDALAEMGEVTKGWLTPDFHMGVEIKLDQDDYRAQKLWKKLDQGKQFGLSIAGHVNDFKDEYEKSAGGKVRTYMDVELEEISLTTKPIYTPSLGTVLRKAADEAEAEEGDKTSMEEVTPVVAETVTPETPAQVAQSAPSGEQVVEPTTPAAEVPAVEKAASDKERAKTIKQIVNMHRDMSRLIAQLVIDDPDEPASADSTATETPVVAAKAEEPAENERLQKAEEEITRLTAIVDDLKSRTPGVQIPEVAVKKADQEELEEMLKSMTPQERLRFALAVTHNGK